MIALRAPARPLLAQLVLALAVALQTVSSLEAQGAAIAAVWLAVGGRECVCTFLVRNQQRRAVEGDVAGVALVLRFVVVRLRLVIRQTQLVSVPTNTDDLKQEYWSVFITHPLPQMSHL